MIDLPPPSYEQTIEAVAKCDIPQKNVSIAYQDYLQSDEVLISDLGPLTEPKLRCLKNAVDPFYILTIEDTTQRTAFYDFSYREDRPKEKADARDWLHAKGLFDHLPTFQTGQSLTSFTTAIEAACGLEAGSALMVFRSSIAVRPDALSEETFDKSARNLECLTQMIAASDAYENGVQFGFIGNEAYAPEEQK